MLWLHDSLISQDLMGVYSFHFEMLPKALEKSISLYYYSRQYDDFHSFLRRLFGFLRVCTVYRLLKGSSSLHSHSLFLLS
jgi:hypothetical protein